MSNKKIYSSIIQNKLEVEDNMLMMVINNVSQHIFWKNVESVFLGCNNNFAKTIGLDKPDEIIGKTDYDIVNKEKADKYIAIDKKVIKENKPIYDMIEYHKEANGDPIWINVNKIPLHDPAGKIIGILGTFQDVTDRITLSEKIQKSEEKYRSLIEFTNTSYMILDTNLQILEINQHFAELMEEESLEDILHHNPRAWVYTKDIAKFDKFFGDVLKGNETVDLEINLVNKNKELIYVSFVANIIENGNVKIFCLLRDISHKKLSQEKQHIAQQKRKDKLVQKITQIRNEIKKNIG